jgi:hypothetical protein
MKNKKSCEEIQNLLVANELQNFKAEDRKLILDHLQSCEDCCNLERAVHAFEKTGSIDPTQNVTPLGEVKKSLLKRFRIIYQNKRMKPHGLWDSIQQALNYRIPVYQAISVVVILAIGFIFLVQKPIPPVANDSADILANQKDTVQYRALDMFVNFNYLDQEKSGRNSEEDSVLTRYIFKSL